MVVNSYLENNPEIVPYIVRTEGEKSKWGRLVCHWKEVDPEDRSVELNSHIFTPLINWNTGDYYLDCSKKKIYCKLATHLLLRPLLIAIKTVYHAMIPLSLIHVVYKSVQEGKEEKLGSKEIAKKCLKNSVNSLLDIVRTPAYGVAMLIVNIAALVIGPLAPKTLYDAREATGWLIKRLHRQDRLTPGIFHGDLFPCLAPFGNLKNISKKNREQKDTDYSDPSTDALRGLNNLARNEIWFRRDHYACFNNPFGTLDPKVRFVSPSYGDVEKVQKAIS